MERPMQPLPLRRLVPEPGPSDEPSAPMGEFICPGCGRPLEIVLHSTLCFAEAQMYCADCERDYREKRGRWAE